MQGARWIYISFRTVVTHPHGMLMIVQPSSFMYLGFCHLQNLETEAPKPGPSWGNALGVLDAYPFSWSSSSPGRP